MTEAGPGVVAEPNSGPDATPAAGSPTVATGRRPRWWPASVRARTLLVSGVLALILIAVGALVPIPYVALGPGVTYNTLGSAQNTEVITLSGDVPADIAKDAAETSPTGHLNMTTISVYDDQVLFGALYLWATGDYSIVPRSDIYPPNESVEQVNQQNAKDFADSQSAAEIAALRYLNTQAVAQHKAAPYPNVVYVGTIPASSPSAKVLNPQDQIVSIDGAKVTDYNSLKTALTGRKPGQKVTVGILRNGASLSEPVVLESGAAAGQQNTGNQGFLGIGAVERPKAPFQIHISLADIGGPSAGLMFTLGILDKLTPGDMTGGKFIAGTGTMEVDDEKGTVGAIGGILLKEIAARNAGASWFLTPSDNCPEALTRVPAGLHLVKVSTLADAASAVQKIASGGNPTGC